MALPKLIRVLGGAIPSASDLTRRQYDPPSETLDPGSVANAIT